MGGILMGVTKIITAGWPILHDRSLNILKAAYGPRRGLEVYKKALLAQDLGWYRLAQEVDRATVLRLRRDLLDAGLLGGVYEDDVSVEEMARCILEMQPEPAPEAMGGGGGGL